MKFKMNEITRSLCQEIKGHLSARDILPKAHNSLLNNIRI